MILQEGNNNGMECSSAFDRFPRFSKSQGLGVFSWELPYLGTYLNDRGFPSSAQETGNWRVLAVNPVPGRSGSKV